MLPSDLTYRQYEALRKFKENVVDILTPQHTDGWLIKWLRGHNYNVKETEDAFRGSMRCREVYNIDTFPEGYIKPEVTLKYEYTSFLGIAKNGSPVRYTRMGTGDHIGLAMSMSVYDICLYCTSIMEYDLQELRKENQRTGKEVCEVTYVVDMEGFQISQVFNKSVIEISFDLIQVLQDFYPEIWGNIFIINVPGYFDKVFTMFKPIIRMHLLQKIRMADKDATPSLLLKYISEDVLPQFLGGKRVDSFGDPRCSEFIKFGAKVPQEYYLKNRTPLDPTDIGVTEKWIGARSVFNLSLVIKKAPSNIHIECRTENGSLRYKMLFRPFAENSRETPLPEPEEYLDEHNPKCNVLFVSPGSTAQTHVAPIDYVCKAPWPGVYIFKFDNTYSWFTSRKLIYRIREV